MATTQKPAKKAVAKKAPAKKAVAKKAPAKQAPANITVRVSLLAADPVDVEMNAGSTVKQAVEAGAQKSQVRLSTDAVQFIRNGDPVTGDAVVQQGDLVSATKRVSNG